MKTSLKIFSKFVRILKIRSECSLRYAWNRPEMLVRQYETIMGNNEVNLLLSQDKTYGNDSLILMLLEKNSFTKLIIYDFNL